MYLNSVENNETIQKKLGYSTEHFSSCIEGSSKETITQCRKYDFRRPKKKLKLVYSVVEVITLVNRLVTVVPLRQMYQG